MTQFYTYLLTDPRTNIPFYVGKGHGRRAWDITGRNVQVRGRLDKLKALGLKPIVEVAQTPTEKDAFWFEKDLIASLGRKDLKQGPLLNHTDGGDAGPVMYGDTNPMRTKEGRAAYDAAVGGDKNPSYRPEVREKLSATKKGDKNPMKRAEHRERMRRNNPMHNPVFLERNAAAKRGKKKK